MAENTIYDLVIIGGGPAGYVAAIRAAQLGLKTACIERDKLGGICNNWGCIPTKALLASAEFYDRLKHDAAAQGILADNIRHDWNTIISRSRNVADTGARGVGSLFKKHRIDHLLGHGKIMSVKPGEIRIEILATPNTAGALSGGAQTILTKRVIIATGAAPRALPGADFDGEKIITSKEAMSLQTQPRTLLIVGSGAIGMEFAYFYNAFGTKVTVIEMLDRLLPNEDAEVSATIAKSFAKQGIDCRTATKTLAVKKTDLGVELTIAPVSDETKTETLSAEKVLVAVGVRGKYDGIIDTKISPALEIFKDHIKVNKKTYETNLPGVYAVGDVIGPPWLAHVASEEAIVCVERIAGHHAIDIDYDAIPGCTYCQPQVASMGLTEKKLQDQGKKIGVDYAVGKFPFMASGKARAVGHTDGFVKIISAVKTGEILGVHMVGENVTELLAEMGLAKRLEATTEEIIATMHAHPTLSEAVHEAALGTRGRMIHF